MPSSLIAYRSGYLYQLAETYSVIISIKPVHDIATGYISLDREGRLTIKKGYAWDGPSGPAIDTRSAMRGSLVHDAGYQILRSGLMASSVRKNWDELYRQCCLEDGMWPLRAWWQFVALKRFGAAAAAPFGEKKILVAP